MFSGSFLFVIFLVAVMSLGIAFLLDVQLPKVSWKRRALYSALGGAGIPMLIPILVVIIEAGGEDELLIVVAALLVLTVVLAALIGFPAAYWLSRRRHLAREPEKPEDVFE